MTADTITDGVRIAELLSSEVTGLETGALAATDIVHATSDVSPTADGVEAYRIAHAEAVVATVTVYPTHVEIAVNGNREWEAGSLASSTPELPGITIEDTILRVERAAAVKGATDVLRATLESDHGH